jgi:ribonuclease D
MKTLTTTKELEEFCFYAEKFPYITIDTEFLREKTYYAKLCLVQLALPGKSKNDAVLVDPLIKDEFSFEPLFRLFKNKNILKVFHAGRQDLEIFYNLGQCIPQPLFDTQVAAMVCGFGDQVSYEILAKKVLNVNVDKASRFSDWSRRPLTDAQKQYALGDVTHLRGIFEFLASEIKRNNRESWIQEEMNILESINTYVTDPREAWRRVKFRNKSPEFLSVVRELASFREMYAKNKNIPRTRVFKDDSLLEIASSKPKTLTDLQNLRLLTRDARSGSISVGIIDAVSLGENWPKVDLPSISKLEIRAQKNEALIDLLKVLLKSICEEHGVSQKLIASVSDLEEVSRGVPDTLVMKGWRYEIFGKMANQLCNGEISLTAIDRSIKILNIS